MNIIEYHPGLRQACLALFDSNTPAFFAPQERAEFIDWLGKMETDRRKESGACYYYVAEEAGEPVACGGFYISPDGWNARMAWGMVGRSWHKKGIGREFLNFRIRRIRQLFPHCSIALDTTQHSYKFFEKQGFVVSKITPDYYAPGLDRYDMDLRGDSVSL